MTILVWTALLCSAMVALCGLEGLRWDRYSDPRAAACATITSLGNLILLLIVYRVAGNPPESHLVGALLGSIKWGLLLGLILFLLGPARTTIRWLARAAAE